MLTSLRPLMAALAVSAAALACSQPVFAEPADRVSCDSLRDFTIDMLDDAVTSEQMMERYGKDHEVQQAAYFEIVEALNAIVPAATPEELRSLPGVVYTWCYHTKGV